MGVELNFDKLESSVIPTIQSASKSIDDLINGVNTDSIIKKLDGIKGSKEVLASVELPKGIKSPEAKALLSSNKEADITAEAGKIFDELKSDLTDAVNYVKNLLNTAKQTCKGLEGDVNGLITRYAQVERQGQQIASQITLPKAGASASAQQTAQKSLKDVAQEVIQGKWGNGEQRIKQLKEAGYNPQEVQTVVSKLMRGETLNNSETMPQVVNAPKIEKKTGKEVTVTGDGYENGYKKGEKTYINYKQDKGSYARDDIYSDVPNETIWQYGCGLTCMSIVASGYNHEDITPVEVAQRVTKKGRYSLDDPINKEKLEEGLEKMRSRLRFREYFRDE